MGQGSAPILVFDAWEHAFCLQDKNQKVDFIEAMWQVVNWQDVESATPPPRSAATACSSNRDTWTTPMSCS